MAATTTTTPAAAPVAIPLRELGPWVALASVVLLQVLYFVGAEQGATAVLGGEQVHELVHDARHLLGFPCH